MSVLIDEYGRPIILFDAEDTKKRIKGVDAYKVYLNYLTISQTSWQLEELLLSLKLLWDLKEWTRC